MLNIKTKKSNFGKEIIISNEINSFKIMYGGNLDLYFSVEMSRRELFDQENPVEFIIDESDKELFPLFKRLYEKITAYEPLDIFEEVEPVCFPIPSFEEDNDYEREIDKNREYPLVHDGIISWHSDDCIPDISSILNIKLEKGKIILEFVKSKSEEEFNPYSVRIRNDGSSYDPFNCRFMQLYNELCQIDFNQDQEENKEVCRKLTHNQ